MAVSRGVVGGSCGGGGSNKLAWSERQLVMVQLSNKSALKSFLFSLFSRKFLGLGFVKGSLIWQVDDTLPPFLVTPQQCTLCKVPAPLFHLIFIILIPCVLFFFSFFLFSIKFYTLLKIYIKINLEIIIKKLFQCITIFSIICNSVYEFFFSSTQEIEEPRWSISQLGMASGDWVRMFLIFFVLFCFVFFFQILFLDFVFKMSLYIYIYIT
jgi:hypothetical protein